MTDKTQWMRARPNVLREEAHYVVTWHHTVPADMPFEEMLKPDFWTHVARNLRPHHRIVVDCEDGSWTATLFVRAAGRLSASVAVLSRTVFEDAPALPAAETGYTVSWGGPSQKHRVVRKSDSEIVRHGFDTKEQAAAWIKNHQAVA